MNILKRKQKGLPFTAKKILPTLAISMSLITATAQAADKPTSYVELSKQLTIMNNIFKSSIQAQDNRKLRGTKVDSLYLAGQGVVFTVNAANSLTWNSGDFSFTMPDIVSPVAPIPPEGSDIDFEFFSDDENIVIQIESDHEEQQDLHRELHEQQRDLDYDLRDVARETKDLAYQLRNVEKSEQAKLKKEQKALAKQKAALEKVKISLEKKSKQLKAQQQKQQAKRQKQRSEQNALLTTTLIETLCSYGNSLKALPKNEHVSLIIKSAGDRAGRKGYKDQIYVFNKKDIAACANDSITTAKLSSLAMDYQF